MIGRLLVFDTSIYIPRLRGEAYVGLMRKAARTGRVRLSAIVAAELYAGTRSRGDKADLDTAVRAYRSRGFLVTPDGEDWAGAGQAIRRYRETYGEIVPRDHLNDVLLLLSAGRIGAEVVTEESKAFARWAALLRRMGRTVRIRAVGREEHLDQ